MARWRGSCAGATVAIDAEATAFLGRGLYRRGDRARVGWRNGYEPKAVQTEAGLLKFAVPEQAKIRPVVAGRPRWLSRASKHSYAFLTAAAGYPLD
jgi:hypothetical protein